MSKISKFLNMNKYERKLSICRNLFYIIHRKQFCRIGHKSYILNPIFLSGTKYISIGDQSGIWHHARIEVLDEWNGIPYEPKLEIGNHVMIGQDFHVACADSIKIEDNVDKAGTGTGNLYKTGADWRGDFYREGLYDSFRSQNRKTLCHWSKYSSDKRYSRLCNSGRKSCQSYKDRAGVMRIRY